MPRVLAEAHVARAEPELLVRPVPVRMVLARMVLTVAVRVRTVLVPTLPKVPVRSVGPSATTPSAEKMPTPERQSAQA